MITEQLVFFQDTGEKSNSFNPAVPIELLEISEHNPRRSIDKKHIQNLADLIDKNGFDNTFALKCYQQDDVYKVFAGGNRLAACQMLELSTVPVFVYEGYTDQEIWRMAYDDNEQAGTQKQLSIVDVWLDYKAKAEKGWTQQRIADSLNVSQKNVGFKIQFAAFPLSILQRFSTNENLSEGHARELLRLVHCTKNGWYNRETFLLEIINNILSRTTKPTSKHFQREVEKYNEAIREVEEQLKRFDGGLHAEKFLLDITGKKARTKAVISNQANIWFKRQANEKNREAKRRIAEIHEQEQEALKAMRQAEQDAKKQEVTDRIKHGSCLDLLPSAPDNIKCVFIDPPYGVGFQSNSRTVALKAKKIANDSNIEIATDLFKKSLELVWDKLADNSTLLVWCNWKCESEFKEVIERAGFTIKGSLIWVKANHTSGDLEHAFAPKHERLIHATKGKVKLQNRLPDVQHGNEFLETGHPTPKPIDLMKRLIECVTMENEMVVDYFMGCGSTGVAAIQSQRKFWGCELYGEYWEEALNNVHNLI